MADNTVLSDREKAMKWWNSLDDTSKLIRWTDFCKENFSPSLRPTELSGKEITSIWRKETSPTTTVKEPLNLVTGWYNRVYLALAAMIEAHSEDSYHSQLERKAILQEAIEALKAANPKLP